MARMKKIYININGYNTNIPTIRKSGMWKKSSKTRYYRIPRQRPQKRKGVTGYR